MVTVVVPALVNTSVDDHRLSGGNTLNIRRGLSSAVGERVLFSVSREVKSMRF